ncbi:hypothetical protein VNO77_01277 [Canavalia gladiata]|uniref:Glycosyltransferase n=1 Tax=Canavalia gladiata TaxID=3824 RepID=A0AAN9MRL1_CANGL
MVLHHVLLVIFPAQGHINPAIQFAKRLIAMDASVTIPVTLHMHRRLGNKISIPGLSIAPYSDGYDDGYDSSTHDYNHFALESKRRGSDFVADIIVSSAKEGFPFTSLVYTLLLPWAPEVARRFNIPTAMLWIEPATVLDILYYYFHGYANYINDKTKDPSSGSVTLPGLSFSLAARDIPSFLLSWKPTVFSFVLPWFQETVRQLDLEANPIVLVNTFGALEDEALRAIDKLSMIPIGPLIPSAFLDGKDPSDNSFGADIFPVSNDYVEWLDSKLEKSVIYVSFGSYLDLSKAQVEEIARALLDSERPFLWVIREKQELKNVKKEEEEISCIKELKRKGKLVTWCSQVQVLSHPSVGCFLTHCGWNSTLESLALGVPMVAFPQWTDQMTNAKLIEDVWEVGVRVDHKVKEDFGLVEAEEFKRCFETVMRTEEKGNELRKNALKWKDFAREAAKKGGPLENNLRAFLDDVEHQFMQIGDEKQGRAN